MSLSGAHPEYAAWIDWGIHPPRVFWNERVLTDRQFWITDPRMAHEACHLKHGLQPEWTAEEKSATPTGAPSPTPAPPPEGGAYNAAMTSLKR